MMEQMPDHLLRLVAQSESALTSFDTQLWNASRGEGKWTRLQLLGHLIDSAANNHQRFVRAMAAQGSSRPRLDWPGYDQTAHVRFQNYAQADPAVCVALWSSYNRHISHVIRQITPAQSEIPCSINSAPEMTLAELVLDYIAHLEHHLKQLLGSSALEWSDLPWPPAEPNRQWPI